MAKGEGTLEASMVKAYVCRAAEWVTREAMQIHGGMGYAEEFPRQPLLRRRPGAVDLRRRRRDALPAGHREATGQLIPAADAPCRGTPSAWGRMQGMGKRFVTLAVVAALGGRGRPPVGRRRIRYRCLHAGDR